MKKFLLFCALAFGLLAPNASAVTVNDLLKKGNNVQETFYTDNSYNTTPIYTSGSPWFTKNGSYLLVKDALDGHINIQFSVSGNEATFYLHPNYQSVYDIYFPNYNTGYYVGTVIGQYFETEYYYGMIIPLETDYYGNNYYYPELYFENYDDFCKMPATIYDLGGGHYGINLERPFQVIMYDNNDNYVHDTFYNGLYFETFDANATVDVTYTDNQWGEEVEASFTAYFDIKKDNTLEVTNWGNLGESYIVNKDWSYGPTAWTGKWSIEDPDDMWMFIKADESGQLVSNGNALSRYTGSRWDGSDIKDIYGEISLDNVRHENATNSRWASNGGPLRTYSSFTVDFEDWDAVAPGSQRINSKYRNNVVRHYSNTFVEVDKADITHDVSLNIPRFGFGPIDNSGKEYMYVEATITPNNNSRFVESYDLFVVPGLYNYATTSEFNDKDRGHSKGFFIDPDFYTYNYVSKSYVISSYAAETEEDGTINIARLIPADDLEGYINNEKKYTFYLRTIYTPESGLEPSFHALTSSPIPTGVEDILDSCNEDAPVVYYNLNGVQMDGDNLTPGIYIRRQGTETTKVVVK